jgi:hypothetical protein
VGPSETKEIPSFNLRSTLPGRPRKGSKPPISVATVIKSLFYSLERALSLSQLSIIWPALNTNKKNSQLKTRLAPPSETHQLFAHQFTRACVSTSLHQLKRYDLSNPFRFISTLVTARNSSQHRVVRPFFSPEKRFQDPPSSEEC